MTLSNRKLKAFDRRGGAYLVLPWPAPLPKPTGLALDDERRATSREHLAAVPLVADITRRYGLVHIATQAAVLHPHGAGGEPQPWLLAHLVTARWQRTTTPGEPAPAQWLTDRE